MVILPEVFLPQAVLRQMEARAESAYPEECCGLLVGMREGASIRVSRAEPSANMAAHQPGTDARRRFEVDPCLRLALMRELEESDESIVGLYHSHPDHSARPSRHDRDSILEPKLLWLITAVEEGKVGDTTAHLPDPEGRDFQVLSLRVTGGED